MLFIDSEKMGTTRTYYGMVLSFLYCLYTSLPGMGYLVRVLVVGEERGEVWLSVVDFQIFFSFFLHS